MEVRHTAVIPYILEAKAGRSRVGGQPELRIEQETISDNKIGEAKSKLLHIAC